MASMMSWSLNDMEHFLFLYENNSVLWDVNHEGFYNKILRQQAMDHLLKQLQDNGLETDLVQLKARIKNIRDIYRMELRRVLKHKKLSNDNRLGESNSYRPKIAWFKRADSFLRKSVLKKERKTNMDYQHEVQTWITGVPMDNNQEARNIEYIPDEYRTSQKTSSSSSEKLIRTTATSQDNGTLPESSLSMRSPSKDHTTAPRSLSSAPHCNFSRFEKACECVKCSEDPFDLFGKYVVAQIRTLPPRTSILLQQEIQQSITKAVLSNITCEAYVSSSSKTSEKALLV